MIGLAQLNVQSTKNSFQVQTTSFDGRPLLTPSEFRHLFLQDLSSNHQSKSKPRRDQGSFQRNKHKKYHSASQSNLRVKDIDYSSQRRELLRPDSDLDKLENVEKRIKCEDSSSDPSTNYDNLSETNVLSSSPSVVNHRNVDKAIEQKLTDQQQEIPDFLNDGNIVKAVFNYDSEQTIFHIQRTSESFGINSTRLTRDEVLEKDPRLLLYFYESHLQFIKRGEFNPSKLKKV